MSLFNFVFDPANFFGGALLVSSLFGINGILLKHRNKSAITHVKQVADQARLAYKEAVAKQEEHDLQYDMLENRFVTSFPNLPTSTIFPLRQYELYKSNIDKLLLLINKADLVNGVTPKNERAELLRDIKSLSTALQHSYENVEYEFELWNAIIDDNVHFRKAHQEALELFNRCAKAVDHFLTVTSKKYDPSFVAGIPPAFFTFKERVRVFENSLKTVNDTFNIQYSNRNYDIRELDYYKKACKALDSLQAAMSVTDYTKTVMKMTAKRRAVMNRTYITGSREQKAFNVALASLVTAELYDYTGGNPYKEFLELTEPATEYIKTRQLLKPGEVII